MVMQLVTIAAVDNQYCFGNRRVALRDVTTHQISGFGSYSLPPASGMYFLSFFLIEKNCLCWKNGSNPNANFYYV